MKVNAAITLSEAALAFSADRMAKGYAPGTRKNERATLQFLLAEVGNIQVRHIKPQHLDGFWMAHPEWSPGTFNNRRSDLANFFNWCKARGYMNPLDDPMHATRKRKVPQHPRVIIPQSEFANVLETREDARQRITFALGLYVFVRVSEAEHLRWQDVDLDNQRMEVYRPKTKTLDTLPICDELLAELRRWRMFYASMVGTQPLPRWHVVPYMTIPRGVGQKGTKGFVRLAERKIVPDRKGDLSRTLRQGLEDLGYYQTREGGHTLRRSGAIALYDQLSSVGHDRAIRTCQAMLGHSSIQTTEIYLRLDLDRKGALDLLSGKPMFPGATEATITELGGRSGSATR